MSLRDIGILVIGILIGGGVVKYSAIPSAPYTPVASFKEPTFQELDKVSQVDDLTHQKSNKEMVNSFNLFQQSRPLTTAEITTDLSNEEGDPPQNFTEQVSGLPSYLTQQEFSSDTEMMDYLETIVYDPEIYRHDRLDTLEVILAMGSTNSARLIEELMFELRYGEEVETDEIERGLQVMQKHIQYHHTNHVAFWLGHESERVRTMAIMTLKASGNQEYFTEELNELLQDDESIMVKEAAFISLKGRE